MLVRRAVAVAGMGGAERRVQRLRGRQVGALDPAELDWSGAARVSVVLTRSAAQSPESYLEAIDGALSATHTRAERRRLRGSPAVEVVRDTTAKHGQE